jgi:hypothetical protein
LLNLQKLPQAAPGTIDNSTAIQKDPILCCPHIRRKIAVSKKGTHSIASGLVGTKNPATRAEYRNFSLNRRSTINSHNSSTSTVSIPERTENRKPGSTENRIAVIIGTERGRLMRIPI